MKKIYMMVFALLVIFSVTMGAAALQSKTINRQNGIQAYADWTKTTDDLTTDTFLSVTQSNIGTDIWMYICTYDIAGIGSCKSGYMFTQDNVFSMDKKLDFASLKAVQIELFSDWICDENGMCSQTPAGTANIEATWTATGKVSTGSYKWMSKDGNYMAKGSSSSSSRTATAQGTLNNEELGTSAFGGMAKFKSVDMWLTK